MSDYGDQAIAREGLADALEAIAGQSRPKPVLLTGCTCGGIGTSGSHARGCCWAAR